MSSEPTPATDGRGSRARVRVRQQARQVSTPSTGKPTARRVTRNRKVRRVHRVVRHIEVWSVARVTAVFAACGYVVFLVSGFLLWQAAERVGTIDGLEGFMEEAGGYEQFELAGTVVFRLALVGGLLVAAFAVFATVLATVLFNLISDLAGGIRMTVIDEDLVVTPVARPASNGEPARPSSSLSNPPGL